MQKWLQNQTGSSCKFWSAWAVTNRHLLFCNFASLETWGKQTLLLEFKRYESSTANKARQTKYVSYPRLSQKRGDQGFCCPLCLDQHMVFVPLPWCWHKRGDQGAGKAGLSNISLFLFSHLISCGCSGIIMQCLRAMFACALDGLSICLTQIVHFTVPEYLSYWDHKKPRLPARKPSTSYILREINISLLCKWGEWWLKAALFGFFSDNPKIFICPSCLSIVKLLKI